MLFHRTRDHRDAGGCGRLAITATTCAMMIAAAPAAADCTVDLPVKIYASDPDAGDQFGYAVDMKDNLAIVGAPADEPYGFQSGSAYIYRLDGTDWTFETKLVPDDGAAGDFFGCAVAIDGTRAVVGAYYDDDNGSGSGSAYVFQYDGSSWVQEAKLLADDGENGDQFGCSVGIDGWSIVIGAFGDDDHGPEAGAAYAFYLDDMAWVQEAKLLASDGGDNDRLSHAIAISPAGGPLEKTAVLGAPNHGAPGLRPGAAYVFQRDDNGTPSDPSDDFWFEQAIVQADDGEDDDDFGQAVDVDGHTVIVGAYLDDDNGSESGSAYVFRFDGSAWVQEAKLLASDGAIPDCFGCSVGLSGESAVIGARRNQDHGYDSGKAYIFRHDGSAWIQSARLYAHDTTLFDQFGWAVAISGRRALIGTIQDDDMGSAAGSVSVIDSIADCNGNGELDLCDIHLGFSEDLNLNGIPDECEAACDAEEWQELLADDGEAEDRFGSAVAVDGSNALISAPNDEVAGVRAGSAYVFAHNGSSWEQSAHLLTPDPAPLEDFGWSVDLSGDVALIGGRLDDNANGENAGAAYVYRNGASAWAFEQKLQAPDGAEGDQFGSHVAASGDIAAIGAYKDDNENGVNAGSVHLFIYDGATWLHRQCLIAGDGVAFDRFGESVAATADLIVIGSPTDGDAQDAPGATYVFRRDDNGTPGYPLDDTWAEEAKLTAWDGAPDDRFGIDVAVSGDVIVVGAHLDDAHGADSGSAYVFRYAGGSWTFEDKLLASDGEPGAQSGKSVAVCGDMALIGSPVLNRSAHVFMYDGAGWHEQVKLLASDGAPGERFGSAVGISGDAAIIGAPNHDHGGTETGAAFTFTGLADCNENEVIDICDIVNGTSEDLNGNGIPDECEVTCPADINADGTVDVLDLLLLLAAWGPCPACPADINADGVVDVLDLLQLLAAWGPCP